MAKKECSEECCSEHSGVISRLTIGNVIFTVAATVLIAVFSLQAKAIANSAEALTSIQITVAKIEASLPSTKDTLGDLQERTRELERRVQAGGK